MKINMKKVHTFKDLAISLSIIIAGAGIFFLNKDLGSCIVAFGLIMLLIFRSGYRIDGTGAVLRKKSADLCKCCKPSILDYLNGMDITPVIKKGNEGGVIYLEVYYNAEEGIAYAQLFEFRNYTYEPETEMIELHYPKAGRLVSQL